LTGLHFTGEASFFFFSSTNSSTGGAEAVLVNRLAKWLPCEHVFRGLEEEPGKATFFWLHPTPNHCESMFLRASPVKLFHFTPFGRKRLQTAPEVGKEALPNGT